jgi:hypothetical protein
MTAAHYATYTRSDDEVVVLDDGAAGDIQFAPDGLPNVFRHVFSEISIEVPANDPAAAYQTHLLGVREIACKLWIIGDSASAVVTAAADLIDDLGYDVEQKKRGVFSYTADNGITRDIQCSLAEVGELEDWINRYTSYTGTKAVRAKLPLKFKCHSPYWYDPTPVAALGIFNADYDVAIACANDGTVNAPPTITYDGPVTNPTVTDEDGHSFTVEKDLAAGDELVIVMDPAEFAVTYTPSGGAATDVANLQTLASREVTVRGGAAAKLTFTADAGTGSISVSFHPRYRGHGL